jgi:catechol-2,3-dioxygenase
MRVGTPVLRVRNIDKVLAFYERVGLQINRKYPNKNGDLLYELGFKRDFYHTNKSTPLLIIHFDPNAKNQSRHSAGLFHLLYSFQIERVSLRHIWHLKTQYALMNLGDTKEQERLTI